MSGIKLVNVNGRIRGVPIEDVASTSASPTLGSVAVSDGAAEVDVDPLHIDDPDDEDVFQALADVFADVAPSSSHSNQRMVSTASPSTSPPDATSAEDSADDSNIVLGPVDAAMEEDEEAENAGISEPTTSAPKRVPPGFVERWASNRSGRPGIVRYKRGKKNKRNGEVGGPEIVRVYRRRDSPKYKRKLALAVKSYRRNEGGFLKVSKKFGVSKSSLFREIKGDRIQPPGRRSALLDCEESLINKLMMLVGGWGYGLSFSKFADLVESIMKKRHQQELEMWEKLDEDVRDDCPKPKPFFVRKRQRTHRPGRDWMRSFLFRHPELSVRIASNRTLAQASLTQESIET